MLSYFPKSISSIIKKFNKSSIWFKTLSIIVLGLLLTLLLRESPTENFEGSDGKKFVVKKNDQLYDAFYSSVYDELHNNKRLYMHQIDEVQRIAPAKPGVSEILDIGCGHGHVMNTWLRGKYHCYGLDKSKHMRNRAVKIHPHLKKVYKVGDALNSILYPKNRFTHALCWQFTIYYIKNKDLFFKNVYDWLKPGGTLVLHLVNRDLFDPIVTGTDPLTMTSPQKHAPKRIMNSVAKFHDFEYKAKFNYEKGSDTSTFVETFTDDKTKNVRQNEHNLYMETQKDILAKAKKVGFILQGQVNLVPVQYEYQYLYFLQKPK